MQHSILWFDLQNEIIDYDAHRITPEMRSAVNRLLAQKGASFEQANIYRVSQAAAPLAAWVTANLQYADVLQKVAPLEQELGGLTANFTESQVRGQSMHEAPASRIALTRLDRAACQTEWFDVESGARVALVYIHSWQPLVGKACIYARAAPWCWF